MPIINPFEQKKNQVIEDLNMYRNLMHRYGKDPNHSMVARSLLTNVVHLRHVKRQFFA